VTSTAVKRRLCMPFSHSAQNLTQEPIRKAQEDWHEEKEEE